MTLNREKKYTVELTEVQSKGLYFLWQKTMSQDSNVSFKANNSLYSNAPEYSKPINISGKPYNITN